MALPNVNRASGKWEAIHSNAAEYAGTRILNADHRTAGMAISMYLAPLHYAASYPL